MLDGLHEDWEPHSWRVAWRTYSPALPIAEGIILLLCAAIAMRGL